MGVAKFFAGTPYYRQGSLQDLLGMSIGASTFFDQTAHLSNALFPVFRYVRNILAADGVHFYLDDTINLGTHLPAPKRVIDYP
jgi:transposase